MSIKVGDLVMVVKPVLCCGDSTSIGMIFTAGEKYEGLSKCTKCGSRDMTNGFWVDGKYEVKDSFRLIKIDPPALPESLEREKELSV
jgi:hypothetical protein